MKLVRNINIGFDQADHLSNNFSSINPAPLTERINSSAGGKTLVTCSKNRFNKGNSTVLIPFLVTFTQISTKNNLTPVS